MGSAICEAVLAHRPTRAKASSRRCNMRNSISKTIVAGVAALAMAAAVALPASPASAAWRQLAWRRRLAWRRLAWRRLAWRRMARRMVGAGAAAMEWRLARRGWGYGGWGWALGGRRGRSRYLSLLGRHTYYGYRIYGYGYGCWRYADGSADQRAAPRLSRASCERGPFRSGAGRKTPHHRLRNAGREKERNMPRPIMSFL